MPVILWDASGLAKRYAPEIGSQTVDLLFNNVSPADMVCTTPGYAETFSILLRKWNGGRIAAATFQTAAAALENDVLLSLHFRLLTVDDGDYLGGFSLMKTHNLNSSDAAILAAFLRFQYAQRSGTPPCCLVAADKRLLRAARAESLMVFDPETSSAQDLSALLAAS